MAVLIRHYPEIELRLNLLATQTCLAKSYWRAAIHCPKRPWPNADKSMRFKFFSETVDALLITDYLHIDNQLIFIFCLFTI
jgi:hypothetical protein